MLIEQILSNTVSQATVAAPPATTALRTNPGMAAKLAAARENLDSIVANGVARTSGVIGRVLNEVPTDRVVRASALSFTTPKSDEELMIRVAGGNAEPIHDHAWGQMLGRLGVPKAYADDLATAHEDEAWKLKLIAHTLNEHAKNADGRMLLRSYNGQLRGVLSDQYRRYDSRPLLESFIGACNEVGAVPIEGIANDVRVSVRAIIPTVFEPVPGEAMVFGLGWDNSDYGSGAYAVKAFIMRLICLNGAMGQSAMRHVHLGGKLDENIEFSAKTYALDTKTMASATNDVVRNELAPKAIETRLNKVRAAHATETSFEAAWRKVNKTLTKADQKAVKESFEGPDVVMLPAGKTLWRFSNALSWAAGQTDNADRKLMLQSRPENENLRNTRVRRLCWLRYRPKPARRTESALPRMQGAARARQPRRSKGEGPCGVSRKAPASSRRPEVASRNESLALAQSRKGPRECASLAQLT